VSGLRLFDAAHGEHRTRHARIKHGVPTRLEPCAEQRDVRRTSHAVGAFDDDQLAAVLFVLDAR